MIANPILLPPADRERFNLLEANFHLFAVYVGQWLIGVDKGHFVIVQSFQITLQLVNSLRSKPSHDKAFLAFHLDWKVLTEEENQEVAAELLFTGFDPLNFLMDGLLFVECVKDVVTGSLGDHHLYINKKVRSQAVAQ